MMLFFQFFRFETAIMEMFPDENCFTRYSKNVHTHMSIYFNNLHTIWTDFDQLTDINSILHLTCNGVRDPDFIKMGLKFDPNLGLIDNLLRVPIYIRSYHLACALNSIMEMGANPNKIDTEGNTILHHLARKSSFRIIDHKRFIDVLLKFNANFNIRNNYGDTALHLAVSHGALHLIKPLLDNGACVFTKNKYGLTPMDLGYTVRDDYPEVFREMMKFAIILNICNVPIDPEHWDKNLSSDSMQAFNVQCCEELSTLRNIKVGDSNVTLYVILKSSTYVFAKYLRNFEILEWFQNFKTESFEIFGGRLKQHFKESLARKEAEDYGYPFCRRIFRSLPELCVEKLMTYLTNNDLNNLK